MRRKNVRNIQKPQLPDCCTCIRRNGCERYAENSYCTRWQSTEPEPRGEDPNARWERGEEFEGE